MIPSQILFASLEPGGTASFILLLCTLALACYYLASKVGRMKTRVIGITGTIASGKSLVGKILREMAYPVLDTDKIAHELQATDEVLRARLRARFGDAIFSDSGKLDRKKLASIVFNDKKALQDLNALMHPVIMAECRRRIAELKDASFVFVEVPLLFEAGLQNEYDEIWIVIASEVEVRKRLKERDKLSDEEVEKRIRSQFPQDVKVAGSDYVIDNSGTINDARLRIQELLNLERD
ncbi:MAG: dephospho-CoA kinase [Candidatus Obscuribacterales bacterium]|nr:dephospho-CoA kinase [Candidatus Obscuribacterales bacterium]